MKLLCRLFFIQFVVPVNSMSSEFILQLSNLLLTVTIYLFFMVEIPEVNTWGNSSDKKENIIFKCN